MSANGSVLVGLGDRAPVYDPRKRRRGPVRLMSRAALATIPDGPPFFVTLFDTTTLGALTPGTSQENTFQFTTDFWWTHTTVGANFSSFSSVNPIFSFQLARLFKDPQSGNVATMIYQKSSIASGNYFGTAQEPFELTEPIHLSPGEQMQCQVTYTPNTAEVNTNLTVQIVLCGYIANPPGVS
jgi:hypothetical protein